MRISDWSSDVCSSDLLTSRLSLDFLQKNSHSTLSFTTRFSRELRPQYVTSQASDGLSHFGTLSVHLTTVPLWSRCSTARGRPAIDGLGFRSQAFPSTRRGRDLAVTLEQSP